MAKTNTFKSTTLLKVIAILLILGGVSGAISSLLANTIMEWSESVSGIDLGYEITMLDTVLGVASSILTIVMGVLALIGKQYKLLWILMIVYVLYMIYGVIDAIQLVGFTPFSLVNFIMPALFAWGLYCSKPEEDNVEE